MKTMRISVIIPAYNEEKYISDCLQSVVKYKTEAVAEIIVVNNASNDGTAAIASRFPGVRVVDENKRGLTRARQRGYLEARGELLAYIDADTRVSPRWFEIAQSEFEKNGKLMCLSGPYDYYDVPPLYRFLTDVYWRLFVVPMYWFLGYMVIGGNFIVKRGAVKTINGFDTTIEFYGEDTDLAVRLSKIGKVKFLLPFFIYSSGRRLLGEGIFTTAIRYVSNAAWEILFRKPLLKVHKDIR